MSLPKGRWLVLLFAALLMGSVGLAQTRFTFGSEILLSNLDFRSGLVGWAVRPAGSQVSAQGGVMTLEQPDTDQFIVVSRRLADVQRFDYLRLSAEIKPEGAAQGALFWQKARVVLVGRDADGKAMIQYSHVLAAREGSGDWRDYQAVFKILPGMAEMQLSVELPGVAGRVSVRNLDLRAAEQAGWYSATGLLVIAGWAAAALWGSRRLLAGRGGAGWRQPVLALLLALSLVQVIPQLGANRFAPLTPLGFVDLSGDVTATGSQERPEPMPGEDGQEGLAPTAGERESHGGGPFHDAVEAVRFGQKPLDLFGHLAGFALLTLACLWVSRARPWTVLPYVMGTALAGEVAQWSVQGQFTGADLVELLADFAGVALVCLSLATLDRRLSRAA